MNLVLLMSIIILIIAITMSMVGKGVATKTGTFFVAIDLCFYL
jgi:hypothetical protein